MIKEEIISEFKQFLEELENKYPLPSSNGTIAGMSERVNEFASKFDVMNSLIIEKVNYLLKEANSSDGKEVKELLLSSAKSFLKNHLGI